MRNLSRIGLLPALLLGSCTLPEAEISLTSTASSLSACEEDVPANRSIDGIPAYAQCASTEMSSIFSNNGIDTSTMKLGADWVRTQSRGGYQCTELAHRYLHFVWDVKWIPNGNAGAWCDTPPPPSSGLVQATEPVHGDLIVFAPGSCGAAQATGHVAVVDSVDMATGKLVAVEQNRARRGTYNISCARCFLHVVANDGSRAPNRPLPTDAGMGAAAARDASATSSAGRDAAPEASAVDAGGALPGRTTRDVSGASRGGTRDASTAVDVDESQPPRDSTESPSDDPEDGQDDDEEDDEDAPTTSSVGQEAGCSLAAAGADQGLPVWAGLVLLTLWRRSLRSPAAPASRRSPRRGPPR